MRSPRFTRFAPVPTRAIWSAELYASMETNVNRATASAFSRRSVSRSASVLSAATTSSTVSRKFFCRPRASITTGWRMSHMAMATAAARRVLPMPIVW